MLCTFLNKRLYLKNSVFCMAVKQDDTYIRRRDENRFFCFLVVI